MSTISVHPGRGGNTDRQTPKTGQVVSPCSSKQRKAPASNMVEGKDQHLRLSSSMCARVNVYIYIPPSHTETCIHTYTPPTHKERESD